MDPAWVGVQESPSSFACVVEAWLAASRAPAPKYYITLSPLWLSSASPLHVMAMISSSKRDTDRYLPHPPRTNELRDVLFFTWNVPHVVQIKKKERTTTTTTITEKEREKKERTGTTVIGTRETHAIHLTQRQELTKRDQGLHARREFFDIFFFLFLFPLSRTPFFDVLVWVVARREFQTTSSKTTKTRREGKGRRKRKKIFLRMLNPFGGSKVKK